MCWSLACQQGHLLCGPVEREARSHRTSDRIPINRPSIEPRRPQTLNWRSARRRDERPRARRSDTVPSQQTAAEVKSVGRLRSGFSKLVTGGSEWRPVLSTAMVGQSGSPGQWGRRTLRVERCSLQPWHWHHGGSHACHARRTSTETRQSALVRVGQIAPPDWDAGCDGCRVACVQSQR